jgi:hypothetical protein
MASGDGSSNGQAAYTLTEEGGRLVIRRADGSWVFSLAEDDVRYALQLLANLNAPEP